MAAAGATGPHVLIAGAGLTGLALAERLVAVGWRVTLVEARQRVGGRAHAAVIEGQAYDLGPAWVWDGQPRIAALAARLRVATFRQYATGRLVFEDARGAIRRDLDMATMGNAWRLEGGPARLAEGLAEALPAGTLRLGHRLDRVNSVERGITATLHHGDTTSQVSADRAVLALPPRLAAAIPVTGRSAAATEALAAMPTWMAGHAKVVAVYDRPFWREEGLNGDAVSHRGPLAEIHDASPMTGPAGALFGFVGVPVAARRGRQDALAAAFRALLSRLFGPAAGEPTHLVIEDWADALETASPADETPPAGHPAYGWPDALLPVAGARVLHGASELDDMHGGLLEGALSVAERLADHLLSEAAVPADNPAGG